MSRLAMLAVAAALLWTAAHAIAAVSEVAPLPGIHAVTKMTRIHGRRYVQLKSLEVSGIQGQKLRVSCNGGCGRIKGPIRVTYHRGTKIFHGLNWILEPGRAVSVRVYRPGEVGRYLLLTAHAGDAPALVFKASGCLSSLTSTVACPSKTVIPAPGTSVPQAPVLPPPPPVVTKTLAVATNGHGIGSVTGQGITCPATCSATSLLGTTVTLTAVPSPSSTFAGWSGACTGKATCTVTLSANQTVAATFNLIGDINNDGVVDCTDLSILKANYGKTGLGIPGDLNGDGLVGVTDLSILLSHITPGTPTCP